jgi:type III secretory pathway component EscS
MCLLFIWVAATFNYFLIEYYLRLIKQDLYLTMMWSAGSEIFAYIVGCIIYSYLGLVHTMFRSFVLAFIGIIVLMAYLYGYHGNDLMMIGILILTCKIGISGAIQQACIGTI